MAALRSKPNQYPCGTGWSAKYTPQRIWGVGSLRPCCREHDRLYATGGNEEDRALADEDFYRCIMAKMPQRPLPIIGSPAWVERLRRRRWLCQKRKVLIAARAARAAVREFGGEHFRFR